MRPAEVDALEPGELPGLYGAWEDRQRRKDYRAGVVASLLANVHRESSARPFTPASFFPSLEPWFPPPEPADQDALERKLAAAFERSPA